MFHTVPPARPPPDDPEDRTKLVQFIIDTIEEHAKGSPDMLARRIVGAIEAQGWAVTPGVIPVFDPGAKGRISWV